MADARDEFDFDDDPLNALPANALNELERDALLSTQRPPAASIWRQNAHERAPTGAARPPSDYGFDDDDDDDIINLDEQPLEVQRAYDSWSQHQRIVDLVPTVPAQETGHVEGHSDIVELQARVLQLESERASLQRMVEEARAAAQSNAGEAAVLRQKYDKSAKEYEHKISTLRQLHRDAYNKQSAELEAVKRERERIAADNQFLEHDLVREAAKARQAQRTLREDVAGNKVNERGGDSRTGTPKRSKVLPFRDGFDDGDIVLSPTKARDKSRPGTPKAGVKRKRLGAAIEQSPVQGDPLLLSQPRPQPSPMDVGQSIRSDSRPDAAGDVFSLQSKPDMLQLVLNHNAYGSEERVMEALTRFGFPSNPGTKISSVFYDRLAAANLQGLGIANTLCDIFVSLWDQSLKESFFEPIDIFVDAIQYILVSESLMFARAYVEKIVPLVINTVDIVAIPLGRASIATQSKTREAAQPDKEPCPVNAFEALTVLHRVALACVGHRNDMETFWRRMKFDFVLLILMKVQPLPQISLMLQLLRQSSLPSTFGAILGDEDGGSERQARRESDMVDRLSLLLFEKFPSAEGQGPMIQRDVMNLRVEVLSVLEAMCLTDHGSRVLATHKYAIGRLIRFLHDTIAALYHYHSSTQDLKVRCVNIAMRLLYHLLTTYASIIDIRAKLGVIHGGSHKHLIALTRLAFSDPVFYEEGIDPEAMDAAHQLLDEYLSPVEGEALLQIFSSEQSEA